MSMIDISQVQHGWDVYGSDGDKVGDVADVGPNYVLVSKGFLFTKDVYVPTSAITSVDKDRVYLHVRKDQIDSLGWEQPPIEAWDSTTSTATHSDTDTTTVTTQAMTGDTAYEVRPVQQVTPPPAQASVGTTNEDNLRVRRYEEELQAQKVQREAGEVRVTKDVVEEHQTLEVPVSREEVHVQSRVVDRPVTDTSQAFQEGTISVPVREEDVQVGKAVRVAEELEIDKTAVQETERVTDTVRTERVNVEEIGDLEVERHSERPLAETVRPRD